MFMVVHHIKEHRLEKAAMIVLVSLVQLLKKNMLYYLLNTEKIIIRLSTF